MSSFSGFSESNSDFFGTGQESLKAGQMFCGRYRLEEPQIQKPSNCWKAWDSQEGRNVVLQFLPLEICRQKSVLERLRQTVQGLRTFSHPGILPILALENEESGAYFTVQKWCSGESLASMLEEGTFRKEWIPEILHRLSSALDYAHLLGVVHRDIRPANIFLESDGKELRNVFLAGFVLSAEIRDAAARCSIGQTYLGDARPYFSPELWRGEYPNAASDRYALAVTVYQLFAGRLPFSPADPEMLRMCVLQDMPKEIEGLSEEKNAVLRKAFSKTPAKRFASCREFSFGLERAETAAREAAREKEREKEREREKEKQREEERNSYSAFGGPVVSQPPAPIPSQDSAEISFELDFSNLTSKSSAQKASSKSGIQKSASKSGIQKSASKSGIQKSASASRLNRNSAAAEKPFTFEMPTADSVKPAENPADLAGNFDFLSAQKSDSNAKESAGAPAASNPFGGTAPAGAPAASNPFGGTAPASAPAASNPFGGTAPAGASTASAPFGGTAPASAPTASAPFGGTAPAGAPTASNPFGGTAPAGAPTASNPFGGTAPAGAPTTSNPFGGTAPAGAPTASNSFGGTAPAGAPTASNPFGGTAPAGAPTASNPFGGTAPASTPTESAPFGGTAPAGAPTASNPFGETAPASTPTASAPFGGTAPASTPTASAPFGGTAPAGAPTASNPFGGTAPGAPASYGETAPTASDSFTGTTQAGTPSEPNSYGETAPASVPSATGAYGEIAPTSVPPASDSLTAPFQSGDSSQPLPPTDTSAGASVPPAFPVPPMPPTPPAPPTPPTPPIPPAPPASKTSSSVKSSKGKNVKSSAGIPKRVPVAAAVGAAIVVVVGVILWNHSKSQTTTYISIDEPVKNVPLFADSGSAPAPEPVPASVPAAEPSPAAPAPAPVPAPAAVPAQPAAPAVVSAPAPATPAPAPAAPAKPLQKPDFAKILQHLKKSAFAEAEAELNRGFGMNTSPEDSLRLQRLENVHKFAKFFFEDIEKALERYQPPTEFCDGKYVLVETGKRSAVLHIGGKNVRFTMAEPNSGGQNLFAILYEHRYGDSLSKGNTVPAIGYASFLLLSFPNEKAKAVQLLNQAKTAGAEKNRKIAEDILLELGK